MTRQSVRGEPTWIVSDDGGAPWHPDRATKLGQTIAAKLGIAGTFHGLRHFTATYLVSFQAPSPISTRPVASPMPTPQ